MKADASSGPRGPADCGTCVHFRRAPYEARKTGCWHPEHMVSKQEARYLDQQQTPGDHEKINRRGDCPQHEARPARLPFWRRLWSVGA